MYRRTVVAITLLLFIVSLACNGAPTTAPTAVPETVTPTRRAPTSDDPTNPRGTTSTPTVAPPTDAPTDAPPTLTATPTTPPPIATPTTPPLGPPVILSFTADPAEVVERGAVTLRWQGQGATEARVWWYDRRAMPGVAPAYTGTPNNGSVVINPDNSPINLTLVNAQGETNAQVNLVIRCEHAWAPEIAANPPGSCPGELNNTWAAQQPFENGVMIWFESKGLIYVFYNNGRWYSYADNFREGDPESDPSITPPAGRYQPVRGFGLVWRTYPEVRSGLGWATASESGFQSWMQNYTGIGLHNISTYLRDINLKVYRLEHMGSTWKLYP